MPYSGPILEAEPASWDKFFEINLRTAFVLTKYVVEAGMKAKGGTIINVASVSGLRSTGAGLGIYGVTKAALLMFTRQLARELSPAHIRVNAVAPGVIKTEFSRRLWDTPAIFQNVIANNPSGRIGTTDEVARAVAFLASDAASYINGEVLTVDGGSLA